MYLADTGLLCALLNITSADVLAQSPSVGQVWETFVFAQLRHRERQEGRARSLFFWRDRTREVDFVVDLGASRELYEARWTELATAREATNLLFVRDVMGPTRTARAGLICRAPNGFPLSNGARAVAVSELGWLARRAEKPAAYDYFTKLLGGVLASQSKPGLVAQVTMVW